MLSQIVLRPPSLHISPDEGSKLVYYKLDGISHGGTSAADLRRCRDWEKPPLPDRLLPRSYDAGLPGALMGGFKNQADVLSLRYNHPL